MTLSLGIVRPLDAEASKDLFEAFEASGLKPYTEEQEQEVLKNLAERIEKRKKNATR